MREERMRENVREKREHTTGRQNTNTYTESNTQTHKHTQACTSKHMEHRQSSLFWSVFRVVEEKEAEGAKGQHQQSECEDKLPPLSWKRHELCK